MSVRIMVTGAGALLGQGIIRSIRMSGLDSTVVAVDPNPKAVGLYWADRAYLVPSADHSNYMTEVRRILRCDRPDVLLIGTDVELSTFSKHRQTLEAEFSCSVVVSRPEVVDVADDKWLTYRFLKDSGLPFPASCLPGEERNLLEQVGFPLVVKPRVGARSIGVRVVTDRRSLEEALRLTPNAIIQECVSSAGEEYTAGVVSFDGEFPASIVMRRELRDGNTYRAFVEDSKELNDFVAGAAQMLRPYGPVNFQFRTDDGTPKIFEINARFSGTTPMRAKAGFNEVEMVIRRLREGVPIKQPDVQPLTFLRFWDELAVSSTSVVSTEI